jgi:bile acid:Na+ symporter, BASS family
MMSVIVALKVSAALSLFAVGLDSHPSDATYLLNKPSKLARSLLATDVIMPIVAVAMAAAFNLTEAVEISLVALAVSPVPPVLPAKQIGARGSPTYAISLLVVAALVSVVFIPVSIELVSQFLPAPAKMQPWPIARVVFETVLAPLISGMFIRRIIPTVALRISRPVAFFALAVLITSFALVLSAMWPAMIALVGNGTLASIATFVLVGLGVGHMLGGPDAHDRVVLALATATRHPGVALAIGATNFPRKNAVLPAILVYVILSAIITVPYVIWNKRVNDAPVVDLD